jgi:hypothetical protein
VNRAWKNQRQGDLFMKLQIQAPLFGLFFISGLILAGSDGTYFPVLNLLGLMLIAGSAAASHGLGLFDAFSLD